MTGCGKRPYLSQRAADGALRAIARDPFRTRVYPVRAYRCDDCGMFHLTSLAVAPRFHKGKAASPGKGRR